MTTMFCLSWVKRSYPIFISDFDLLKQPSLYFLSWRTKRMWFVADKEYCGTLYYPYFLKALKGLYQVVKCYTWTEEH